jgi:hypothetical protein
MNSFLKKAWVLALSTVSVIALSATASKAAMRSHNDLIWDANATQGAVILKAKYKESPENGTIDQSIEIEVKNIAPGTVVTYSVDGSRLGSSTADAFGTAMFRMDRFNLPDDGTGRVDGPRAETGSIVRAFKGNQGISAPLILR